VIKNLHALGYTPIINEKEIKLVEEHFSAVAEREGFPVGRPFAYDESQYLHQVPGGVISNLRHQLRLLGKEDRLQATLEESARVRADFGYPIMVTPLSQFVVSQAAINAMLGERYREVTDQVIQYALGLWGKEAPGLIDPDVKDKILSRSRANEWRTWKPAELSLREVRNKFGASISDEELLLRVYAGEDPAKALSTAGAPREHLSAKRPLIQLIQELAGNKRCNQVYIRQPGFLLRFAKSRAPAGSAGGLHN
jgi:oxaloacetate decarboxylase alpha subunit